MILCAGERVIRCTPIEEYVPKLKTSIPLHSVIHHVPRTFDYRSYIHNNNYQSVQTSVPDGSKLKNVFEIPS